MYTPSTFRCDDTETLHGLIRGHPFGLLVSAGGGLQATHLPFMIDGRGEHGTLVGHMARANPQWKGWTGGTEVMVVFSGPHAYVSPAWYRERATVPTWNYAAVHAYGRPRLTEDPAELRAMVERLVALYEPASGGWSIGEAEPVMATELRAIVGFEIPIERLEGKLKFNQNRSRDDREGVVRALTASADPGERAVAGIMRGQLDQES